jgi:hypothetical protein
MTSLTPLDPPKANGSGEFNTPAEPYLFDAAEDLSPLLKQGRSIEPLVIAIAFLALLQPLSLASPDVEGSAWMLRAVSLANSESSSEWLIPGISEKLPARFLPPGITWLQACFLKQFGVQNYWYLPLISYLAGACGIWWSWRLVRLLADSRMALIMVVMLSVHGQLFRIVGSAAPWALCWALTIAALLLFSLHLKKSATFWSWRLVFSGVLVGVAILCGGIGLYSFTASSYSGNSRSLGNGRGAVDCRYSRQLVDFIHHDLLWMACIAKLVHRSICSRRDHLRTPQSP